MISMNALAIAALLEAAAHRITADLLNDPVMKKLAEKVKKEAGGDLAKGQQAAQRIFQQATGFDPKPEEIDALLQLAGLKKSGGAGGKYGTDKRILWTQQFSKDFAVPPELTKLVTDGEADDLSYGNDVAPSFGLFFADDKEEHEIRIWSDHPDASKREFPDGNRFLVVWYPEGAGLSGQDIEEAYNGDDVNEAIKAYRALVQKHWKPEWVRS